MTHDEKMAVEKAVIALGQISGALSCITEATRDQRIVAAVSMVADFADATADKLDAIT